MRIQAAAAACLAMVTVSACNRGAGTGQPQPQGFPPTPVKLAEAHATPLDDFTEYVGTLKSLRSTTVQPQIDGQITQIEVRSGERVRQGDALIQIDPRRQQAA